MVGALETIGLVAGRMAGVAGEYVRSYELGHEPADDAPPPWSLAFQAGAVDTYLLTLPLEYLRDLATDFGACGELMASTHRPEGATADQWDIVASFLVNYREAVLRHPEPADRAPSPPDPASIDETAPGVLRIGQLAAMCRREDAERLAEAAAAVEAACAESQVPELSDDQLGWLADAAAGLSVVDIAERSGWSRATMNRRLGELWEALGTDSRSEGLVAAAAFGLLDPEV